MPTPKKGPRFGRDPAHQRLILANMASSLFEAGYLVTTVAKAKHLRPYAEHLITKAKTGGVHQRRQVIATIHDQDITHKLFAEIGPRYADRPGGYLRILKLGPRPGDNAPMARVELVSTQQLPLEAAASPEPGERVLKLTVAYDGGDFRGFAPQRGARTVHGVLTDTLTMVLQREVDLQGAGRTDAGVHVWGQVVSCPVPDHVDPDAIARSCNSLLGPEVVVRAAELVDPSFHARHSATWRAYRYTIVNRPVPDPFLARTAWWVSEPIDLARLRLGTDPFLGEHDFASFCRTRPGNDTTVRRVLDAVWCADADGVLRFEIRARSFSWQMVRSIVGTLVDVGVGRIRPGEILAIMRARDRNVAGRVAPPHGLCLREVGY